MAVGHVPLPDPLTTNVCFGGADLKTAYATLSGTGKLVSAIRSAKPHLEASSQRYWNVKPTM